jgi:hypothetical protein
LDFEHAVGHSEVVVVPVRLRCSYDDV